MSTRCFVPDALHICPRCRHRLATGTDVHSGEPRICSVCVADLVNRRYSEEQRNLEPLTPPTPDHAEPWSKPEVLFLAAVILVCCAWTLAVLAPLPVVEFLHRVTGL